MRRAVLLVACVLGPAAGTLGCSTLFGIQDGVLAGEDGSADATGDGNVPVDSTTDAPADQGNVETGGDSGGGSDAGDGGDTSVSDAKPGDASDGGDASEGGGCPVGDLACDGGCTPNSVSNCGACGLACSGGTPVCSGTGNTFGCVSGCDAGAPTLCSGTCVDTVNDVNHCGNCTTTCSTAVAHALPSCVNSGCTYVCQPGYNPCNGACDNYTNDNNNCGSCGNVCQGGETCQGTSCACPSGSHLCGGACSSNSSTASCGTTSCTACPVPTNGTATCDGTSCGIACTAPYVQCGNSCVDLNGDPANCGGCSHNCISGACTTGVCQPYAVVAPPNTQEITWVTTDGVNVVYGDEGNGIVAQVPVAGGSPILLSHVSPSGVGLGGGKVGFTQNGGTNFYVATEGVANSGAIQNANAYLTANVFGQVAVDPTGTREFLINNDSSTDTVVYFLNAVQTSTIGDMLGSLVPTNIVASSTAAYWGDPSNGKVWAYTYATNTSAAIITGQNKPDHVGFDSSYVYWVNTGTPALVRMPLPSGLVQVVDPAPGASASLATDGKYVYYSSGAGGGTLSYTPVGGGAIKTLYSVATGSSNPVTQICVAGGFVAWSDPNNFTIYGARTPL